VAASNNWDHVSQSFYYCSFTPLTYGCCSSHTSCLLWIAHSMLHGLKGCDNITLFLQWTIAIACFLWRLHLAWPSHPGHNNILLWSESMSSKCAKLHTIALSNSRDRMPQLLYDCWFTPLTYGHFFAHIPFMVNCTFDTALTERLQQQHAMWRCLISNICLKQQTKTFCMFAIYIIVCYKMYSNN